MFTRPPLAEMLTTTNVLDAALARLSGFRGTFARDTFPTTSGRNTSFIVNSDTAADPGEHWMAVCLPPHPDTFGLFIDPFGLPLYTLYPRLKNFFKHHCTHIKEIPFSIQHVKSNDCGQFCAFILYHLPAYSFDLDRLVRELFSSNDFKSNSSIVGDWWRYINRDTFK